MASLKDLKKNYSDTSKGYIYKITNLLTGKMYIGQTNNPYRRWLEHRYTAFKDLSYSSYLYSSIRKYGLVNFSFDVIDVCDLSVVNEKEVYWITYLNTLVPNGYNLLKGGNVLYGSENPFFGRHHSEDTRRKISERNKGRLVSSEEREMRRQINSGSLNPFYGKHHSDETKELIKRKNIESGTYKKSSERMKQNNPNKYRVYSMVEMIDISSGKVLRVFKNASEAGKFIKEMGWSKAKYPNNAITSVCNRHEKSSCGYFWRYKEESND